jgi:transcriptional regulator with XRE-family HTH domain
MKISSDASARREHLTDRIRRARRHAQLSQTQLAARLGVTASAVAQWEHPHGTSPEIVRLDAIAQATGVNIEWLAVGRGPQTKRPLAGNDIPAVKLEFFAQDDAEEALLQQYRALPPRARHLLSEFLNAIAPARSRAN